jgi:hypothetical protein
LASAPCSFLVSFLLESIFAVNRSDLSKKSV